MQGSVPDDGGAWSLLSLPQAEGSANPQLLCIFHSFTKYGVFANTKRFERKQQPRAAMAAGFVRCLGLVERLQPSPCSLHFSGCLDQGLNLAFGQINAVGVCLLRERHETFPQNSRYLLRGDFPCLTTYIVGLYSNRPNDSALDELHDKIRADVQ
jgi:hypothetical protein